MTATKTTGFCRKCGTRAERDLPEGLEGRWLDFLERIEFMCDACAAAADQAEAAEEAERLADQARRARAGRLSASGIPDTLRGARFDELRPVPAQAAAITAAVGWAEGETSGLMLRGAVGVGKTRIAACAASRMLDRRHVRWMSAPVLFARLGSGFGSQQRDDTLDALTGRAGLVLDDLDKARPTDYAAEHLFLAVDARVTEGTPLLVTTNLSLGEIATRFPEPFGEAIASRLGGYCEVKRIAGTDRRLEQQ